MWHTIMVTAQGFIGGPLELLERERGAKYKLLQNLCRFIVEMGNFLYKLETIEVPGKSLGL